MTALVFLVVGLILILIVSVLYYLNIRGSGSSSELTRLVDPAKVEGRPVAPVQTVSPDSRSFLIVKHNTNGYLILNAYKERKGQHGQLPGGRIDVNEAPEQAAVREFFEETGILVSSPRLKRLPSIGNKYFFFLEITDSDQVKGGTLSNSGETFRLKLSEEHVSYTFYKDIHAASKAVLKHSGGTSAAPRTVA